LVVTSTGYSGGSSDKLLSSLIEPEGCNMGQRISIHTANT